VLCLKRKREEKTEMRHKKLLYGVALLALLVGVVTGYILIQKEIGTSFFIRPSYNLKLLDVDGATDLTFIDLGELTKGGLGYPHNYPATGVYFANNTNEAKFWLGFNVSGAPADMMWVVWIKRGDKTSFVALSVNTTDPEVAIYDQPLMGSADWLVEGDRYATWTLSVYVLPEAEGAASYTANMVFTAHDTATG